MPDETPDLNTMMTVAEAYRLKHLLGQSITWGNSGLNALEIEELTKLTREDYARIRADYREWHVNIGTTTALVILAPGCAVTYAFVNNGWVRIAVVVLEVSFIYRLSKRRPCRGLRCRVRSRDLQNSWHKAGRI